LKNGLLYSYPSAQNNADTEIVVIGGGITGALISHALVDAGFEVVMIDKRDIGQGSTSATTSMLQYEIDLSMLELAKLIGEDASAAIYKAGVSAIDVLEKLVRNLNIDCGFERKRSLQICHDPGVTKTMQEEFRSRDKCGLEVQWLTKEEILKQFGIIGYGGIVSTAGASLDAYKLAHELICLNNTRGMKVFDQTLINQIKTTEKGHTITTEQGARITCETIIYCNGYEATEILKEKVASLYYTYACISEREISIPEELFNTLVWDTNEPYFYMRTTEDGRLLIGGEDSVINSSFLKQKIKEKKAKNLINTAMNTIPQLSFVEDFSWGGIFGATKDGLPYIGKSPEYENSFFVLGFGGNGITFSAQAMAMIPALLKGETHELLQYYRFGR
jgi:glycine/D-amino acid oxidase-like deaminating enzyme